MGQVHAAAWRSTEARLIGCFSTQKSQSDQLAQRFETRGYNAFTDLLEDVDIVDVCTPTAAHRSMVLQAAEAGKHVLCEKPVSLTVEEAISLLKTRDRTGVKIEEAFMIRTHPQWICALDFIRGGRIGSVRSVMGYFSYHNPDLKNIRNILAYGGGALMDIGCYLVYTSRLIFGEEPARVSALIEVDPETGTDVITSGILHFPSGQSVFTCSTRVVAYQRVQIFGTKGRIEIEIPFNAPPDRPCRIFLDDGVDPSGRHAEIVDLQRCDQYTMQGDLFSRSIREGTELPVQLEGSVRNMAVIEAIFRSAKSDQWEKPTVPGL